MKTEEFNHRDTEKFTKTKKEPQRAQSAQRNQHETLSSLRVSLSTLRKKTQ